jgi:outer membrane immunogenic protein
LSERQLRRRYKYDTDWQTFAGRRSGGRFLAVPSQPAPAIAPPASTDWDGPYVGATLGYGWGTTTDTTSTRYNGTPNGVTFGGQVGYNFHLSDNLIAGVEGDLNWNDQQGTTTNAATYRINWDGSVRGRLGVDLDGILPYAEAGVAFANSTVTDTATASATYTGWTVGAGVEFKLADQVSANVEYRYSDYGTQTLNGDTVRLTDNALRVGVNYHF